MVSSLIPSWKIEGEKLEAVTDYIFLGCKITMDSETTMKSNVLAIWKESCNKPRQCIKTKQNKTHHFASKGPNTQSCGLSKSCVV